MGMDASARIFYGYKEPIVNLPTNEEGEYYTFKGDHLILISNLGDAYLAVDDSYFYTDWDYGARQISPQQMFADENAYSYYRLISTWLKENKIPYKEEDIGWFILCDYS